MIKKITKKQPNTPLVLAILDGWGVAPKKHTDDPTLLARLPFLSNLKKHYPYALLKAHGKYVGLPNNQDGNSEAGHLNIGAGRIVEQDSVYISNSIADGTFFKNQALLGAIEHARKYRSKLHLMGLLSNHNSGHSAPDHITALLKLVADHGVKHVYLHLFTDGRDTPKYDAPKLLAELKKRFCDGEQIASVVGRLYAMDRKKEWSRTERTYNLLTRGWGIVDTSAEEAVRHAYNRGESDEFLSPTVICDAHHRPLATIGDNDAVIFFNLRSDRARQLAKPFVQTKFEQENKGAFKRWRVLKNLKFVALTDFGPDLGHIDTAFPSRDIKETLPVVIKEFRQLYVAESEKFAHVTYFFNGGYDHPVNGEKRLMVPSPRVASYDQTPLMGARAITTAVVKVITQNKFDVVVLNFANADMVGHTGNIKACIKALEVIDSSLSQIARAIHTRQGALLITADHGNVEELVNHETGEIDSEHSKNPVPCWLYASDYKGKSFVRKNGVLADVTPTILTLLGVKQPKIMRGRSLLKR